MGRTIGLPLVLLIIGIAGIARFSPTVRSVDAVGLVASGALIGSALVRIMMASQMRRR